MRNLLFEELKYISGGNKDAAMVAGSFTGSVIGENTGIPYAAAYGSAE